MRTPPPCKAGGAAPSEPSPADVRPQETIRVRERSPTILICEDEAPLRELIRIALGKAYRFVETGDGREALGLARKHRPDAILLDVMLPGRSGLEILQAVRADPALAPTAVIAVSAWSHLEDEALAAGADDFVSKPFDPEGLRTRVEKMLASQ